jgi:hypothetical protein
MKTQWEAICKLLSTIPDREEPLYILPVILADLLVVNPLL